MLGNAFPLEGEKQMVSKNIAEEIYSVCTTFQSIKLYSWGTVWNEDFALKTFGGRMDKQGYL